mgnify:CR=1 FL=1
MGFINRLAGAIVIGGIAWFGVLSLNISGIPVFSGILSEFGLYMTMLLVLSEFYILFMPD